jgi:hypothetical protein
VTTPLVQAGKQVFTDTMLATQPYSENHSLLLAEGPHGMKRMALNLGEAEARQKNALRFVTSFIVACAAKEVALLGFQELILVEEDGTPAIPETRQKAVRLSHWNGGQCASLFANIIKYPDRTPEMGGWTELRPGYSFGGQFMDEIRRGMSMSLALELPKYARMRGRIDALREKVPPRQIVQKVTETLDEHGWFRTIGLRT